MAAGPRIEAAEAADRGRPAAEFIQGGNNGHDSTRVTKLADARRTDKPSSERQIVLVLQGGGALGAYQAGVYQALHEHGIEPDWIIGTSIGAINASLIAGNPSGDRLERLKEFWTPHGLSAAVRRSGAGPGFRTRSRTGRRCSAAFRPSSSPTPARSSARTCRSAPTARASIPPRRWKRPCSNSSTSRWSTSASRGSRSAPRMSAPARCSYFDSRDGEIGVKHIMASGALPPAFPAVRIDGELYWDGGILSNTPTEAIFDDNPRKNSLIFAVHLWNPMGEEPGTIWEVLNRQKDIQYSSRVASHIARQRQLHHMRHIINDLAKLLPDDVRKSPEVRELTAYGCPTVMHVVRLLAPQLENENHTKDVDFSPSSIRVRWEAGYDKTMRALDQAPWEDDFDPLEGVILHEPKRPKCCRRRSRG